MKKKMIPDLLESRRPPNLTIDMLYMARIGYLSYTIFCKKKMGRVKRRETRRPKRTKHGPLVKIWQRIREKNNIEGEVDKFYEFQKEMCKNYMEMERIIANINSEDPLERIKASAALLFGVVVDETAVPIDCKYKKRNHKREWKTSLAFSRDKENHTSHLNHVNDDSGEEEVVYVRDRIDAENCKD